MNTIYKLIPLNRFNFEVHTLVPSQMVVVEQQFLTEHEAWTELYWMYKMMDWAPQAEWDGDEHGLCGAVEAMRDEELITEETCEKMLSRIGYEVGLKSHRYWRGYLADPWIPSSRLPYLRKFMKESADESNS